LFADVLAMAKDGNEEFLRYTLDEKRDYRFSRYALTFAFLLFQGKNVFRFFFISFL
jgi:hypothetical protein